MNAPLGATAKFSTPGGPNGTTENLPAARSKCARKRRLSTCWLYRATTSASAAAATRVSWATACAANASRPSAARIRRYRVAPAGARRDRGRGPGKITLASGRLGLQLVELHPRAGDHARQIGRQHH